jgi:H+-transporting ATPase
MPDASAHPLRNALMKFWAPVPWLLEASIVLELALHKVYEAAVIAALLIFNAALAYFQESHARATLASEQGHVHRQLSSNRMHSGWGIPSILGKVFATAVPFSRIQW